MNIKNENNTQTLKKQTRPEQYKFRCALHGSKVCEYPDCTGYDNRKCDFWSRHSSK